MIRSLSLTNIVLVDNADISLTLGLNVLSGESGSGKSAILNALALLQGTRSDTTMIRQGEKSAVVEAIFEIPIQKEKEIHALLMSAGIESIEGEDLIIRRVLSATGRSKAYVNSQAAHLSLLKGLAPCLFDMVSQHASQNLLSLEFHRDTLDQVAYATQDRIAYQEALASEKSLEKQIESHVEEEARRLRELATLRAELEELTSANIKEGEEEELFKEYTLLSHKDEIANFCHTLNQVIAEQEGSVLQTLRQNLTHFQSLVDLSPELKSSLEAYQSSIAELDEIANALSSQQENLDVSPERLGIVNDRLTLINHLKRKYGQIEAYQEELKERLNHLENSEEHLHEMQEELIRKKSHTNTLAQKLSQKRREAAPKLAQTITEKLGQLNMAKASFYVELNETDRSRSGDESIEFFIQPNPGERKASVRESASGGEVARILLAIKTLTAEQAPPTLVFDEIDANIGGQTASLIGETLRSIGESQQVICITHFPQVAEKAHRHFQISKEERGGRTLTRIHTLTQDERQSELTRMAGKAY